MNLSPLVTETFLWFIERWAQTYLFINKDDYRSNYCRYVTNRNNNNKSNNRLFN